MLLPKDFYNLWQGKPAFVLASGPSLTEADVQRVKDVAQPRGWPVLVTNTTFKLARWADVLFFHDRTWWKVHGLTVKRTFPQVCVTIDGVRDPQVLIMPKNLINTYRNSGSGAISFAVYAGCHKVILLGLDGKFAADGTRHWHGDHPKGLGNAASLPMITSKFPEQAKDLLAKGIDVVNATRDTAVTCFRQQALEAVLTELTGAAA